MNDRSKFLKIYANLPLTSREEIVVVLGNEPMTWNSAMLEIEQNTKNGKEILRILKSLKIIKQHVKQ